MGSGASQEQHRSRLSWSYSQRSMRRLPEIRYDVMAVSNGRYAGLAWESLIRSGLGQVDDFSLKLGDSLRQSIDLGLARSRFGVVILSGHFFQKHGPQQELNGLATREVNAEKVILPVWHGVGFVEVRNYSPTLADRLAVQTKDGLAHVVAKIIEAVK